jgi:hypothetical protein
VLFMKTFLVDNNIFDELIRDEEQAFMCLLEQLVLNRKIKLITTKVVEFQKSEIKDVEKLEKIAHACNLLQIEVKDEVTWIYAAKTYPLPYGNTPEIKAHFGDRTSTSNYQDALIWAATKYYGAILIIQNKKDFSEKKKKRFSQNAELEIVDFEG